MIRLKNILAENMRRFGAKNLHEAPTFETRKLQLYDLLISLKDKSGGELLVDADVGLDGQSREKKLIEGTFDANESLKLCIRVKDATVLDKGLFKIYGDINGGDFSKPTISMRNALGVKKNLTLINEGRFKYIGTLSANDFCVMRTQSVPFKPINLDCGTVTLGISYSNINKQQGGQEGGFDIHLNATSCDVRPTIASVTRSDSDNSAPY